MASAQDDVHLLYELNAPDYKKASVQSLFDKIAPDPSLSTFLDVLTGVEDIFQLINATHKQELTIFCPINGAFHDHVESTRENLKEFLQYHIVPSYIEPDNLKRVDTLKTLLDDETISVSYHFFSQRIVLNDLATVDTVHTIEAVNGIAYKIDHLLLRPTVSA
ncbi:FAS1 domain-containing protein [Gilbertella persicaria]|uniref:FAS1 domain-containing protein n=1 Tax=Gilbertella persicaria TaxID=101096 RepID=UPI00221E4371|nr:FAS1 domain-containing protein [Gilbertella persicaria]KAI8058690.1 FAS1 domain-containing protein [Gilbertella persicaria]